jgi:hypothetical protein|tara:strand:+ start:587 stop:727 length:141 start_codon:yes stop_codon:yes gene_type:complete
MKLSERLRQQLDQLKKSDERLQELYKNYLESTEQLLKTQQELLEKN